MLAPSEAKKAAVPPLLIPLSRLAALTGYSASTIRLYRNQGRFGVVNLSDRRFGCLPLDAAALRGSREPTLDELRTEIAAAVRGRSRLSVPETAVATTLAPRTIRSRGHRGQFPLRCDGPHQYVNVEELTAWLLSRRIPPSSERARATTWREVRRMEVQS